MSCNHSSTSPTRPLFDAMFQLTACYVCNRTSTGWWLITYCFRCPIFVLGSLVCMYSYADVCVLVRWCLCTCTLMFVYLYADVCVLVRWCLWTCTLTFVYSYAGVCVLIRWCSCTRTPQAGDRVEYEQRKAAEYAARSSKRDLREKRLRTMVDDDDKPQGQGSTSFYLRSVFVYKHDDKAFEDWLSLCNA